jgi:uncharacterized membrane protein (UPF0127 family)
MRLDPTQRYHLLSQTHGTTIARHVLVAVSLWSRMKGLLGRRGLGADAALILPQCRSIHTVGMRFPIDVVFIDRTFRVVALREGLGPWQVVCPVWTAWGVIEMAQGAVRGTGIQVGDQLQLEISQSEISPQ